MNYGRIGECIAFVIMALCVVGVVGCVVALWISAPLVVAIGATVFILALATMILCFELDRRTR